MDDSRPVGLTDLGDLRIPVDESVDEGAPVVAGPGMDDEAGRLVDHDHVGVLVDDTEFDGRIRDGARVYRRR
jgi:hypothetical protein